MELSYRLTNVDLELCDLAFQISPQLLCVLVQSFLVRQALLYLGNNLLIRRLKILHLDSSIHIVVTKNHLFVSKVNELVEYHIFDLLSLSGTSF